MGVKTTISFLLALFLTACSGDCENGELDCEPSSLPISNDFQDRQWVLTSYQKDTGEVVNIAEVVPFPFLFTFIGSDSGNGILEMQLPCKPERSSYTFNDSILIVTPMASIAIPCSIRTEETLSAEIFIADMFDRQSLILITIEQTMTIRSGDNRELRFVQSA